jgi:DNA polymerase-1
MAQKLFLLDGTAMIYRAYFALSRNPLRNSRGENTSAIFGVINMFIKFVERFSPDYVAISFDRKEKTFRHEITETYKANRPSAPDELNEQVEPIINFFELIGIPEVSVAGYEADDVIATLAKKFKSDYEIIIVSGDKDFSQIVDDRISLYDPMKEKVTREEDIFERYGIKPEQFIDYLAICGDSSDNIPGIKGVGPKGAVKLLDEFETLENIYVNIDKIKPESTKKKVSAHKEDAYQSKKLATIIQDVELEVDGIEQFRFKTENLGKALPLLKRYELTSIIKKLASTSEIAPELDFGKDDDAIEFEAKLIDTADEFSTLCKELSKAEIIALDTETTSLDAMKAELVGISLCYDNKKAYYISIGHKMSNTIAEKEVISQLSKVMKDKTIVCHHLKYDYLILHQSGFEFPQKYFDTMLASYVLDPSVQHSLSACALREFSHHMTPISELIGKGKKQITFDMVPVVEAANYSAEDAYITFKLYDLLKSRLEEKKMTSLYDNIELPLVFVLAAMEEKGVYIDQKMLREISQNNQKYLGKLIKEIYKIVGYEFNLNSSQQLAKALFEDMGIPPVKKTKTGYSTDSSVLEKLSQEHEVAKLLLEYRQITKLESTYVQALPKLVNERTGRLHSSFNQTVTSTGRLSSANPNLQNIPIRREMGKEIRKAFGTPDKDYLILSADYSQIELRLLALFSGDPNMLKAFREGADIHAQTAHIIFNVPAEEITPDQRRYAKIINFGLLYGMGAYRLSNELDTSRKEAEDFIQNYFNKFPTIKEYLANSVNQAKEKGYAETMFGRRLYLPELKSSNKMRVQEAERVATNMPIQGSAADIIKLAMISIHEKTRKIDGIDMLIQVHDELVFEVKKEKLEDAKKIITTEMEKALPEKYRKDITLTVEIGVGENWYEAH